jgi:predicted Fe-S protein YdhL (DUF1289 family)
MMTVKEMIREISSMTDEERESIMKEMFQESPVKPGTKMAVISDEEQEADSYDEEWGPDFENAEIDEQEG